MLARLDLSPGGIARWLTQKSAGLRQAVQAQARTETWTVDSDPNVVSLISDAGDALADIDGKVAAQLFSMQPTLDELRQLLMYMSPPRRLLLLEYLDQIGHLHDIDFGVLLLETPPAIQTNAAQAAVHVIATSIENLDARRLLHEIFAPERLKFILDALTGQRVA